MKNCVHMFLQQSRTDKPNTSEGLFMFIAATIGEGETTTTLVPHLAVQLDATKSFTLDI